MKKYDIIFLGGGQAGIFGAYEAMEKNSALKVLIVDKGKMLKNRVCPKETLGKCVNCPTCAIIYGVSGAGAFSGFLNLIWIIKWAEMFTLLQEKKL